MTASLSPGALPHPLAYATWVAPRNTNPKTPVNTNRIMSRSFRLGPLPDAVWMDPRVLPLPVADKPQSRRAFNKSLNFRTFTEPERDNAGTPALNLGTTWVLRLTRRPV